MRSLLRGTALTALLISVASIPVAADASSSATRTPKVGDCWNYSFNQSDAWSSPTARVSCKAKHTAVTYYVGTITGVAAKAASPTDDAVGTQALSRCMILRHTRISSKVALTLAEQEPSAYVPTPGEWKAGKRFFRCDATQYTSGPPRFSSTPANYLAVLKTAKGRSTFAWCKTSGGSDVKCTSTHRSRAVSFVSLGGLSRAYPGLAKVKGEVASGCASSVESQLHETWAGRYTYPSKARWQYGDRTGTCFQNGK